jgi:hypothetical protein
MNQKDLLEYLEQHNDKISEMRKDLKYFGTSFDMVCPEIREDIVLKKMCFEHDFSEKNMHRLVWCQFPFKEQEHNHNYIQRLFEIERGDTVFISEPSFCYLMCANLWGQGLNPTDKWVVVGCMSISKETIIDWIWVHPILRRKGLTKLFLTSYSCNAGPLIVQPPVSEDMKKCLKSIQEIILADPQLKTSFYGVMRAYISQIAGETLSYLNDESIQKLMTGLSFLSMQAVEDKDLGEDQKKNIIKAMIATTYMVQQNPELKNEMMEYLAKIKNEKA